MPSRATDIGVDQGADLRSAPGPGIVALLVAFGAGIAGAFRLADGDFLPGTALLALSVAALRFRSPFWQVDDPPELAPLGRYLALALVVAIGAFFRFHRMTPPGLWGDDAINGLLALDVLDGKITSPFQIVQHSQNKLHALTNFIIAGCFWAFGPGLGTLRLGGVILNLLCVPLVYATFAPLFRARVALCAALFFAVSPVQLSHAKILLQVTTGEFFQLLGMCLLVRGLCGSRRWLAALSGVPLALSLCTYHSFKVGPLVAAIFVLACLLTAPRQARLRLAAWAVAGFVVLLLSSVPGLLGYVDDPSALTARLQNTSSLGARGFDDATGAVWDSIWRTSAIFHYQQGPRGVNWVGIGSDPALSVVLAVLVCHGLVQSLRHAREPRHVLLLAWFAVGLLPGLLSSEAPRIYRVLMATVPVYVWAALPLERLLAWAGTPRSRLAAVLAGLVLLGEPVIDFNDYFYRVYTDPNYNTTHATRMVDMARTLRRYGPGWTGHLLAEGYGSTHDTFRFLQRIWKLDMRDVASLTEILPLRADSNALLLFDPSTIAAMAAVQSYYPGAVAEVHPRARPRRSWLDGLFRDDAPREQPLAAALPLSRETVASRRGLTALFLAADGTPLGTRPWPQLAYRDDVKTRAGLSPATRVVLSGTLYAPRDGSYSFFLDAPRPASLRLDGNALLFAPERRDAQFELEPVELAEGPHTIAAAFDIAPGDSFEVLWQAPGEIQRGPISPMLLGPDSEIRGWLSEYVSGEQHQRRLEPIAWYRLFLRTFDGRYDVHWRGRLQVPEGGRRLEIRCRDPLKVSVDGKPSDTARALEAGEHEIELDLVGVVGAESLALVWSAAGGAAVPVPPEAFLPPRG